MAGAYIPPSKRKRDSLTASWTEAALTGMMGVSLPIVSYPRLFRTPTMRFLLSQSLVTREGVFLIMRSAAMDAAASAAGRVVEKSRLLAVFDIQSMRTLEPATKAPKEPQAFENVPIWTIHGSGRILK